MSTKLYVGNLPFDINEDDLRNMLSAHGPVNEVAVVMDKVTGRARGFAFVTMGAQDEADKAISMFNTHKMGEQELKVNIAKPKE